MRALSYKTLQDQGSMLDLVTSFVMLPILMLLLFTAVGHQIVHKSNKKAKHWRWRFITRRNGSIWQV